MGTIRPRLGLRGVVNEKSPQDHSYRLNLLGSNPTYAKRHAVF